MVIKEGHLIKHPIGSVHHAEGRMRRLRMIRRPRTKGLLLMPRLIHVIYPRRSKRRSEVTFPQVMSKVR